MTNDNLQDVTVYLVGFAVTSEVGMVASGMTETFPFPPGAAGEPTVRVLVDQIGSLSAYLSDPVIYAPGDVIEVRVAESLELSSVLASPGTR